jgi:hypothetical protein
MEEKREEEAAPEESQAFSRYRPDDNTLPPAYVLGALVLAAFAGSVIRRGPRGRGRGQHLEAAPATVAERRSRTLDRRRGT